MISITANDEIRHRSMTANRDAQGNFINQNAIA